MILPIRPPAISSRPRRCQPRRLRPSPWRPRPSPRGRGGRPACSRAAPPPAPCRRAWSAVSTCWMASWTLGSNGCPTVGTRRDALPAERLGELALDEREPVGDGLHVARALRALDGALEVVEHREAPPGAAPRGPLAARVLQLFARALAEVVEVGRGAEPRLLEAGRLGLRQDQWVRRPRGGRRVGLRLRRTRGVDVAFVDDCLGLGGPAAVRFVLHRPQYKSSRPED